jgi:hypothetical protein
MNIPFLYKFRDSIALNQISGLLGDQGRNHFCEFNPGIYGPIKGNTKLTREINQGSG